MSASAKQPWVVKILRTVRDGQKANQGYTIAMRSPNSIVDKPIGHINWIEVVLAGRHRNGSLVAANNNGTIHATISDVRYILCKCVL